ncbi:hypothetical protein RRG08_014533 [Elysia crispata]|uniref:Uncharacterized protein n=1 Tax=Elysia crispata TaxID=231223 RepID=A0AAE1AXC6_9GAST|nr:hypothetical protein RRG08_014533 [Elysia crispata]
MDPFIKLHSTSFFSFTVFKHDAGDVECDKCLTPPLHPKLRDSLSVPATLPSGPHLGSGGARGSLPLFGNNACFEWGKIAIEVTVLGKLHLSGDTGKVLKRDQRCFMHAKPMLALSALISLSHISFYTHSYVKTPKFT